MEGPWKDQMGPMEGHGTSDGRMGGWWKVMEHQMEGHGASDGRMSGRHGPREEAKVKDPRLVARSMGQGQNRWSPPNAYAYAYDIDIYGQGIYRSPGQWAYSPWVV